MSGYYPLSAPLEFVKQTGVTGALKFNATGTNNIRIQDFITTTRGDMIYCQTGGVDNFLERLPIGTTNQYLKVSSDGVPTWSTLDSLHTIIGTAKTFTGTGTGLIPYSSAILTGWTGTSITNSGTAYSTFSSSPLDYNTGILTIPATGVYHFDVNLLYTQSANTGVRREFGLVLSPSPGPGTILARMTNQPGSSTTAINTLALSYQGQFNSGDTIAVECSRDGAVAATMIIQVGSRMGITRLN